MLDMNGASSLPLNIAIKTQKIRRRRIAHVIEVPAREI
jgi:hypothetical protein